ncbi:GNAT family N-acetyltransferase [Streptomyces sp. SID7909]|uniref:GNAT family N-acetyltransferase n=1 Tax=Streptomyces sp. SID7909 TaxID=2706092 RepID=UPI0013BD4163|nr:GNAT family N-acetyltransferase [Streptomyces sp. SID7909]NEC06575.1 GNAT family N-acetyltransferase [Streptomyces sp. SID7909]
MRAVNERMELPGGLVLRPWETTDAPAVREAFAEPGMERQADAPVGSVSDAVLWIRRRQDQWGLGVAFGFAVADASGAALGGVAVSSLGNRHATGWISYWTGSAARGRGVATLGCRALVDWCFAELDLFRLELGHRTNNPASCRVALASGFAAEGVQRQKLAYDGVRYDVETHARLATDPVR